MRALPEFLASTSIDDPVVSEGAALSWRLARSAGEEENAELLATSTALLLSRRRQGHVCLHLEEWASKGFPLVEREGAEPLPGVDAWRAALERSSLVGRGTEPALLVLDGRNRLYLHRDHQAEGELGRRLRARLQVRPGSPPHDESAALFDDAELRARVEQALSSGLTLVTGGPGTGKTTAVSRLLTLLARQNPSLRVALGAPTGKAAARLAESLRREVEALGLEPALREALSAEVKTLHRLLRYHPGRERFGHDAEHPLSADVVVVDEASMVDLHLLLALVRATPENARLILVGDPGQLASIEAGTVLADLRHAAHSAPDSSALGRSLVELERNWRFEEQPGISRLSAAIRAGDAEEALAVLADPALEDARWAAAPARDSLLEEVESLWSQALEARDPREALEALDHGRILCALREGPAGVGGLRRRIGAHLVEQGVDVGRGYHRGQPLLVLENAPDLGLANGDLGVCVEIEGKLRVAFESAGPQPRLLAPHRLPRHETAWAMTVHKSQGSEFDRVWLVLPPRGHPLATRELLYTGVTRARREVVLFGEEQTLRDAVTRVTHRHSGLVERMREVDP